MKLGKLSFGVTAVQAGQKSATVNAEPVLVANSTAGKFAVTSPVSKALNIAVGENIMFLNNIPAVEIAIQTRNEDVVAYAAEQGIDIDSREGQDALLKEFTQWFIAKGVPMYTSKGEAIMSTERFTKEDKAKYLAEHALEIVAANREALVEQFGEGTDEELASHLTVDMVESPKYHSASGSRTSTSSSSTGVGCQLNFTDSAIWGALKADLGEAKEKKNRIFDVVLKDAQETLYNNGKENVKITIIPIVYKEDADVIARVAKKD